MQLALQTNITLSRIEAMERDNNPRLDDLLVVVAYLGVPLGSVIRHPRRTVAWGSRV